MLKLVGFSIALAAHLLWSGFVLAQRTPTEALLHKINQLPQKERQSALEAGARKEGTVITYGIMSSRAMKKFAGAFEARYPFIKVQHARKGGKESIQQAAMEHQSGKVRADMTFIGIFYQHEKVWARYSTPHREAILPGFVTDRGVIFEFRPVVIAYHTKMVGDAAPRGWKDLLNPRWKQHPQVPSCCAIWNLVMPPIAFVGSQASRCWRCWKDKNENRQSPSVSSSYPSR